MLCVSEYWPSMSTALHPSVDCIRSPVITALQLSLPLFWKVLRTQEENHFSSRLHEAGTDNVVTSNTVILQQEARISTRSKWVITQTLH